MSDFMAVFISFFLCLLEKRAQNTTTSFLENILFLIHYATQVLESRNLPSS